MRKLLISLIVTMTFFTAMPMALAVDEGFRGRYHARYRAVSGFSYCENLRNTVRIEYLSPNRRRFEYTDRRGRFVLRYVGGRRPWRYVEKALFAIALAYRARRDTAVGVSGDQDCGYRVRLRRIR